MRNILYSLHHLNTWSLAGGAVWAGLGCLTFLEEMCHWEQRIQPSPISGLFSLFLLLVLDTRSQSQAPATVIATPCLPSATVDSEPSGAISQKSIQSPISCPGHGVLSWGKRWIPMEKVQSLSTHQALYDLAFCCLFLLGFLLPHPDTFLCSCY